MTESVKKIARVYLRVSTDNQDLERQRTLVKDAEAAGYYIAGTYEDKASGVNMNRPGLIKLLNDLRPNDVIIVEHIDRLSRLPLEEARQLVNKIKEKKATLSIDGLTTTDFRKIINYEGLPEVAKLVLEKVQDMLLEIALQTAHSDYQLRKQRTRSGIDRAKKQGKYKGRPANTLKHKQIIEFARSAHYTNKEIAALAGCSMSLVEKVKRKHQNLIVIGVVSEFGQ